MIYLPENHPLTSRTDVGEYSLNDWMSAPKAGVKTVLLLNLMPEKEETDRHFTEILSRTGRDVRLVPLRMRGMVYKTTPAAYVDSFYEEVESVMASGLRFDRLIVTGAPLENVCYEECRYWMRLCEIMDWAKEKVDSTLYICWAAMAALYRRYGTPRERLERKCFGVFPAIILKSSSPLVCGMGETVTMPHSRHIALNESDILALPEEEVELIAKGEKCGPCLMASPDGRSVYLTGHPEYEAARLDFEYRRDVAKGRQILPPEGYYAADGVTPVFSWRKDAERLYGNWVRGAYEM